jgi:hypothetical protein
MFAHQEALLAEPLERVAGNVDGRRLAIYDWRPVEP